MDPSARGAALRARRLAATEALRGVRRATASAHSSSCRYRILAVEQTSNSVSLEAYAFPSHAVLLLGKEKEGIPVEFLHLVDDVRPPSLRVRASHSLAVHPDSAAWAHGTAPLPPLIWC